MAHQDRQQDFEASIITINDAGEAILQFANGARTTLQLTSEQLARYRQAMLTDRARAGTLVSAAGNDHTPNRWPSSGVNGAEGGDELVIGDRNWFYC